MATAFGRFRKRPVVISAVRWDGLQETADMLATAMGLALLDVDDHRVLTIATLEGNMCAQVGDWIIEGLKGEFYPCKPDIFDASYLPVRGGKDPCQLSPQKR